MSDTKKQRFDYIDATKGVAILCITFLHFEKGVIPGWLNTWIGLFMISAFYVTSGCVTGIKDKPTTVKELFKKRIKQLGVPYLWFSILIIAFEILWVLCGFMEGNILLRDIYKTLVFRGIGTLWFLPVLFIGELFFTFVKTRRHKWIWAAIALAVTIVANYFYNTNWLHLRNLSTLNQIIDAPMQPIVRGLYAWPIIAIGYIFGKRWGKKLIYFNKLALTAISATLLALSILLVIAPPFEIYYINGILSNTLPAIAFMCFFVIIGRNFFSSIFTYWGVNSLVLMCTHYSITMELLMAFDKHVLHHSVFEGPITILYFVICTALTYPIVRIFNGKLKFMLGK